MHGLRGEAPDGPCGTAIPRPRARKTRPLGGAGLRRFSEPQASGPADENFQEGILCSDR